MIQYRQPLRHKHVDDMFIIATSWPVRKIRKNQIMAETEGPCSAEICSIKKCIMLLVAGEPMRIRVAVQCLPFARPGSQMVPLVVGQWVFIVTWAFVSRESSTLCLM